MLNIVMGLILWCIIGCVVIYIEAHCIDKYISNDSFEEWSNDTIGEDRKENIRDMMHNEIDIKDPNQIVIIGYMIVALLLWPIGVLYTIFTLIKRK